VVQLDEQTDILVNVEIVPQPDEEVETSPSDDNAAFSHKNQILDTESLRKAMDAASLDVAKKQLQQKNERRDQERSATEMDGIDQVYLTYQITI